jgi:hypothetical protein
MDFDVAVTVLFRGRELDLAELPSYLLRECKKRNHMMFSERGTTVYFESDAEAREAVVWLKMHGLVNAEILPQRPQANALQY